jgi:hypothetical protein
VIVSTGDNGGVVGIVFAAVAVAVADALPSSRNMLAA